MIMPGILGKDQAWHVIQTSQLALCLDACTAVTAPYMLYVNKFQLCSYQLQGLRM
jgi:hypothetical protein